MIRKDIDICTQDLHNIIATGSLSLDAQVRAYDLIEKLLDLPSDVHCALGDAAEYCKTYRENADAINRAYDEVALNRQERDCSAKLEAEMNKAFEAAQKAKELHNLAKSTFDIWQHRGYFTRHKALRNLRARAGFRLESSRIGNYVAKTFDLANEAQTAYASAQQKFFASNASYKIVSGTHSRIAEILQSSI